MRLLRTGDDPSLETLCDAVSAAGPEQSDAVLALVAHADAPVRRAVAVQLPFLTDDDPTDALVAAAITLTTDVDAGVRDWACTALGTQWRDLDTVPLREALAARLDDADADTRCEALVGLAYRRDPRVLPRIRAALTRPDGIVTRLEIIAAGATCDPSLHPLVSAHLDGWDNPEPSRQAEAAHRLTDPAGPGEDLLDGVARMYRTLQPRDPDPRWWHLMGDMLTSAPHRTHEFYDAVLARLASDDAALVRLRDHSALGQMAADLPRELDTFGG